MIELATSDYNSFVKILSLTIKGQNELAKPTLNSKKLANKINFKPTEITEEDRAKFEAMGGFFKKLMTNKKGCYLW